MKGGRGQKGRLPRSASRPTTNRLVSIRMRRMTLRPRQQLRRSKARSIPRHLSALPSRPHRLPVWLMPRQRHRTEPLAMRGRLKLQRRPPSRSSSMYGARAAAAPKSGAVSGARPNGSARARAAVGCQPRMQRRRSAPSQRRMPPSRALRQLRQLQPCLVAHVDSGVSSGANGTTAASDGRKIIVLSIVLNVTVIVQNARAASGHISSRREPTTRIVATMPRIASARSRSTQTRHLPSLRPSRPSLRQTPRSAAEAASLVSADRQRIDRWLWNARIVRTRSAAAALTGVGYVRVNGVRVAAPGRDVKRGDVVTVALDGGVRVLKVTGLASRRGNAAAALRLYEDLSKPRE